MHRPLNSLYGPTKAALETMTLAWAQDLPDTGVTVNSLSPGGSVDTDLVLPAVRARAAETGKILSSRSHCSSRNLARLRTIELFYGLPLCWQ